MFCIPKYTKELRTMKTETEPKKSEQKIIAALTFAENQKLRWSDLVAQTKLSKRALSQTLKCLQKQQRIRRTVDTQTDEYPPPVYYQLTNELERRFAELVNKEWQTINERMNVLFKITFEEGEPQLYFQKILEAILMDCAFTLHYAAEAPSAFKSLMLLEWHLRTHQQIMAKTFEQFRSSKRYRQALRQTYEVIRDDFMKAEVQHS